MTMSKVTVKYRSSKEVTAALKKAMKNQEEDHIGSGGDQGQILAMDDGSPMSEVPREQSSVLEISSDSELSQPPPTAPARNFSATKPPSQTQFFKSVVMLKGLAGVLKETKDADKAEILDASFLNDDQDQVNIVFDILNFIHNEFFFTSSVLDKNLLQWMRMAVKVIVDLLNEYVNHPVVKNGEQACEEFLQQSFNLIRNSKLVNTMELVNFLRITVNFGDHFSVGIIFVSLVLEELHRTGELLIQSFLARSNPPANIFEDFGIYMKLLYSLLPDFGVTASSVIGVGNAEKDKLVIPKVRLAEIRRFSLYLDNWAKLVDISHIGFFEIDKEAAAELRQVKRLISDIKQKIFMKKIK